MRKARIKPEVEKTQGGEINDLIEVSTSRVGLFFSSISVFSSKITLEIRPPERPWNINRCMNCVDASVYQSGLICAYPV